MSDYEKNSKEYKPSSKKWGNAKNKEVLPFYKREIIYDEKQLTRYALNKLSRQDFGRVELFKKMTNYQKEESIVNKVLDRLEELGYLSDARRMNSIFNQFSHREAVYKTSQRLSQRGFTKEQIKDVMEERIDNDYLQDEDLPVSLLERKFHNMHGQELSFEEKRKLQDKMTRFLISRGFNFDKIKIAIKEFFLTEDN